MQASVRYLLALVAVVATAFSAVHANPVPVRILTPSARALLLTHPSSAPLPGRPAPGA
ncbi:hypothetical protein L226DRAFT_532374, partial [Lentinus tigrinus ALCF2SS1-7]|uniref:uncharacterized protein n=1 Tax=Lentinus tigrinus ALCF2SS1-7 TaxID=1328758 RepID=UPI0011662080